MERQRVVFGTTHLYQTVQVFHGQAPVSHFRYRDTTELFWSTGRLEEALARNMEVHIVSIRFAFGMHDDWWQELVPKERIHSNKDIFREDERLCRKHVRLRFMKYWRKMFRALELPWSDEFTDFDHPLVALVNDHGFIDGRILRGYADPSNRP